MKGELRNKPRVFESITDLQRTFGLPKPLHPLISLLDYSNVQITGEMLATTFVMDFYNITYNESAGCKMRYGQTTYDFDEGGMFFTSPGQPLTGLQTAASSSGFTLLIHPDFLRNYPLAIKIKNYGFSHIQSRNRYTSRTKKKLLLPPWQRTSVTSWKQPSTS